MRLRLLLVLCACAIVGEAPALDIRASRGDNLRYQLDCLAGIVRCTRDQLPLADAVTPRDLEAWRRSATAADAALPTDTGLPLPTAADLRAVSSRHVESGVGSGTPDSVARGAILEALADRTARRWSSDVAPHLARLELGLDLAARRIALGDLLPRLAGLFGLADERPTVSLIALAASASGSIATLAADTSYVETPIGDTPENRLPVIVHEFVHHWQRRMPADRRRIIVEAFVDSADPCAVTAYHFFDEAIATAIGNGLVEQRLLEPDAFDAYRAVPESFYADARIDRIAKALLPRLRRQLRTGDAIDAGFIDDYVRIAAAALGRECGDLTSRLHTVAFVLGSASLDAAQRLAQQRLAPSTAFTDIVVDDAADTAAARYPALSGILVATRDSLDRMRPLLPQALVEHLRRQVELDGRVVHAWPRSAHSTLYVVVGIDDDAAAAALLQLVALRTRAFTGAWRPPPLPVSVPD